MRDIECMIGQIEQLQYKVYILEKKVDQLEKEKYGR